MNCCCSYCCRCQPHDFWLGLSLLHQIDAAVSSTIAYCPPYLLLLCFQLVLVLQKKKKDEGEEGDHFLASHLSLSLSFLLFFILSSYVASTSPYFLLKAPAGPMAVSLTLPCFGHPYYTTTNRIICQDG